MLLETTTYLGPAKIVKVEGARLRLHLLDQEVTATMATSFPYRPAEGDVVLAIGHEENYYVIGVIDGSGKTSFVAPGNLEFCAPRGTIQLKSPKGVRIQGGEINLQSKALHVTAEQSKESFVQSVRWVTEDCEVKAGSLRQIVDDKYSVKAVRISELAERDIRIDGEQINLG